jgi:hypothetical protein
MDNNSIKHYQFIKKSLNEFLDKRTGPYKSLKAANTLCRKSIEERLFENPKIKNLILQNSEQSTWMKELVVDYTLLKMQQNALLWEIDAHKPTTSGDVSD